MTFVSGLEPTEVWRHFDKILTIPRSSKNEQAMRDYIVEIAKKHKLSYEQDAGGNLVVRKPAATGCESAPTTALQSHLDMVCEKNDDVNFDFSRDAIKPRQEDGYLYATGTTLGSDNGMGVAAELALMESYSIQHGPLELLFTIDEETGLTGASSLSSDLLRGRQLINLDTEEEGALYVGCAGGQGVDLKLPLSFSAPSSGTVTLKLKMFGLRGGHSGVDIHLQRGNAIKLLARALNALVDKFKFELARIHGGNVHNAIPREAYATIVLEQNQEKVFRGALWQQLAAIQAEYKIADPDLDLQIASENGVDQVLATETAHRVLNLLIAMPHGVVAMSNDIPDMVETSANLARVTVEDSKFHIHVSSRSSVISAQQALQERITSIGRLAGAAVEATPGYPGWKPNLKSGLLKSGKQVYRQIFGVDPEIKAIHAGLECGIIGQKYPGMDMLSIGPQIEFPHSPSERVRIGSVADFYKLLVGILEKLAK